MVRGRGGAGEAEKLAVDAVLALLGGEPSRAVLGECGIGVEAGPGEVG
jgi:hypothetical protein